jgi:hypothetical protein
MLPARAGASTGMHATPVEMSSQRGISVTVSQ